MEREISYRVDTGTGLIEPARQCPSPNQDERPDGSSPELIVIHGISLPPGQYGGPEIEQLFTNCLDWSAHPYFAEIRGMQVSSHLLIRRDGAKLFSQQRNLWAPLGAAHAAAMQ